MFCADVTVGDTELLVGCGEELALAVVLDWLMVVVLVVVVLSSGGSDVGTEVDD